MRSHGKLDCLDESRFVARLVEASLLCSPDRLSSSLMSAYRRESKALSLLCKLSALREDKLRFVRRIKMDCPQDQLKNYGGGDGGQLAPLSQQPLHNNYHHHHHLNHHQQHQHRQRQQQQRHSSSQSQVDHDNLTNQARFSSFFAEFVSTFIFVYLGQAATTSFELIGTQNDTITRQLASTLNYGLAYLTATLLALNISGAHLNPVYTIASAIFGQLKWSLAVSYVSAQYLGSFMAAIFLHATYSDKLNQRHSEGLLIGMNSTLKAHGNILSTGKLFSSYPPTDVSLTQLFIGYTLAAAHLMLLMRTIHHSKLLRIPTSAKPFYLAIALCLILTAFSANGGPVLNPAQDFSPRLYIALFGWGSSSFNLYHYKYWWLCGILAPHVGALLGFGLYQILDHLNNVRDTHHSNRHHSVLDDNTHRYTLSSGNEC